MPKIDESRPFIPVRIAILTMSDTRTLAEDKSGTALVDMIGEAGHQVADRALVRDDIAQIRAKVQGWIADAKANEATYKAWFKSAKEVPGSWWPEWTSWLATHSGKKVAVKNSYGNARYKPTEAAPGSYVKVRAT